jgi:hypothetical protein
LYGREIRSEEISLTVDRFITNEESFLNEFNDRLPAFVVKVNEQVRKAA